MKKIKIIFISIIAICILVPLVFFNTEKDVISTIDNKYLTEITEPVISKDFTSNLDNYISDRVGFRETLINLYNKFEEKVFNTLANPKFEKIGDDYIPSINDEGEYDEYEEKFVEAVSKVAKYCEERNTPFYLMFSPDKIAVYNELIPKGINYSTDRIEKILDRLEENGVTVVNNLDYFKSIKDDVQIFNKRHDTIHWSELGAFYGINNLLKTIKNDFPNVELNNIDDYEIIDKYYGDGSTGLKEDEIVKTLSEIEDFTDMTSETINDLSLREPFIQFNHYINNKEGSENLPKIMSFVGSFMFTDDDMRFLANQSSQYYAIHNYQNLFDIPKFFNMFQPDLVVFEFAQFTVQEYYFSSELMDAINYQPGLQSLDYKDIDIHDFIYAETRIYGNYTQTTAVGRPDIEFDYAYIKFNDKVYDLKCVDDYYWAILRNGTIPCGSIIEIVFSNKNEKVNYHYWAYVY